MTDDDNTDDADDAGVPDLDPQYYEPLHDFTDAEKASLNFRLDDDSDPEDLRTFVDAVERDEIDADPGVVRFVRSLLDDDEGAE